MTAREALRLPEVAALYVQTGGCYSDVPGVDLWDEARDARLYHGPQPVVAHPPCQRWGRYSENHPIKGKIAITGDDGGCFEHALWSVRTFGGVIEHPKDSKAFVGQYGFDLGQPMGLGWCISNDGIGWICQVEQGHYGHFARKPTWLYAAHCDLPSLIWGPSEQRLPAYAVERYGYAKARRIGAIAAVGGKNKTRIREATPPPPISRPAALDSPQCARPGESRMNTQDRARTILAEARALVGQAEIGPIARPIVTQLCAALEAALTPAEADVETVERVAGVLDNFENGFGYELRLTRLVDGDATHTLTYNDGSEPIDFSDRNDAYAHIQHRRSQDRARAVIASLAALPPRPADDASKPRFNKTGDSITWQEDGVLHHATSISYPSDDVAKLREALGDRSEWASKRLDLQTWTGSAFLADEPVEDEAACKTDLYSFLCGLLGYLQAGEDAADLASRAALAGEKGNG